MTAASTADEFDAEVIAAFGRHLLVRAGAQELRARPAGRRLSIVCGDRVRCEFDRAHDEVLIVEVLPRRTLLARANLRGESEPVVANITQLVVVIAPLPQPDYFIVDRYLCAATAAGIAGAIAINKCDLDANNLESGEIDAYVTAGYAQVACSATVGTGLTELRALLASGVSVLVGQSGVGKSSLVNRWLGSAQQATLPIDDNDRGRHATTRRQLFAVPDGGLVIDTPGMRSFGLLESDSLADSFAEIAALAARCRFRDCQHQGEPGCAVDAAIEAGELDPARRDGLHKLGREIAAAERRRDPVLAREERARMRTLHKEMRARTRSESKLRR